MRMRACDIYFDLPEPRVPAFPSMREDDPLNDIRMDEDAYGLFDEDPEVEDFRNNHGQGFALAEDDDEDDFDEGFNDPLDDDFFADEDEDFGEGHFARHYVYDDEF